MSSTKRFQCKDCGSTSTHIIGKLPNVNTFAGKLISPALQGGYLVECKNCWLKFRSTEFDQPTLNEMYDGGLSEWEVDKNRNDWKLLSSYIDENYPNSVSVLDIGCNRGEILAQINSRNERYGLEINSKAAAIAKKLEGITVWDKYSDIPTNKKFDVIFSTDVIEHISSPTSFLTPLFDMLNDNGSLIITTGDSNNVFSKLFGSKWWYCYFPEHVSFISKKWIKYFTGNHNITIKSIKKYYYHNLSFIKRIRLLVTSFIFSLINQNYQTKILSIIHKTEHPNRFQIGKNVSKDHILVVLKKQVQ